MRNSRKNKTKTTRVLAGNVPYTHHYPQSRASTYREDMLRASPKAGTVHTRCYVDEAAHLYRVQGEDEVSRG